MYVFKTLLQTVRIEICKTHNVEWQEMLLLLHVVFSCFFRISEREVERGCTF